MIASFPSSFSLNFDLDLSNPIPGDLFRLGESLHLLLREAETSSKSALSFWDRIRQNYLSFPMPDGRCLVVELISRVESTNPERTGQRIGFPLGALPRLGTVKLSVRVSPARVQLVVDGQLMDEEGALYPLVPLAGEQWISPLISNFVLEDSCPAIVDPPFPGPVNLQYFSSPGHNAWAGDTMCVVHEEKFHLFYLFDRRHGISKFGTGSHGIAHAVSSDLRTWEHQPWAVPISEPWLTCGTGVPIVRDGKIHLFYGMHTNRMVPDDQTCTPELWEEFRETGSTQPAPFFRDGKYPRGTVIATSVNGVRFETEPVVVHPCENPSPFVDPTTGKTYLLAGYGDEGLYVSDDLKHWTLEDRKFVPCNRDTPKGNTLECQCLFEWNGWYYLIGGRTGFWMSRNRLGPFWQGAKNAGSGQVHTPRWDIYDGLWVPVVAPWKGNRRILSGWLSGPEFEWGGHFVFRELIQHEDGMLGTKWVEEMIPESGPEQVGVSRVEVDGTSETAFADAGKIPASCRISLQMQPSPGVKAFGLRIGSCELKFDPVTGKAQWATMTGPEPSPNLPTLEEILAIEPYCPIWRNPHPNIPCAGGDFTIQDVEGLEKPFHLDLIAKLDPKSGSTIVDACIDGRRTMISRRAGLVASELNFFVQGGRLCVESLSVRSLR